MYALPKVAVVLIALLPKPDALLGWEWRGEPRVYSPDTLYEYIDGSADLYLSYGFEEAAVADYVRGGEEGDWITVDVYDMGAPLHAFGICGAEKPSDCESFPAGAQGYATDNLIAFWQGDYYVKVMLVAGEDADAVRALAAEVGEGLPGGGSLPDELKRLPEKGRVAGSERYVKTSALGHKFLVEVVSADYALGDARARLHIGDLATVEKAREGMQKLRAFEERASEGVNALSGVGEDAFGARDPYYGEMVAARQGQFLVLAISEEAGGAELTALARRAVPLLAPACEGGVCRIE